MPVGDAYTSGDASTPSGRAGGFPAAEVAVVSGLAAAHVLDHRVVPRRVHVATHLATAGATVAAALAAGATVEDLGLAPSHGLAGLKRGAIVSAALLGALGLAAWSPRTRRLFEDRRLRDVAPSTVAFRAVVEIPLGTALSEELIFRGALLGLARRRMSTPAAVAATSVLFGLWHVLPSLADRDMNPLTDDRPPAAVVAGTVAFTTLAGLMFSVERLTTGSVVAPIMTHTTSNVGTLVIAHLVQRRNPVGDAAQGLDAEPIGTVTVNDRVGP